MKEMKKINHLCHSLCTYTNGYKQIRMCALHLSFPWGTASTSSSTCGVREFGLFAKHSTVREGFKPTTGLIQDTVIACRVSPAHDNAIIKKREEAKGRRAALPSLFSLRVIPASGKTFFFFCLLWHAGSSFFKRAWWRQSNKNPLLTILSARHLKI